MKHILALIITICATSHAADWYAGARIGHAFVNNDDFPKIEKPIEYGGRIGVYSEKNIGVELGVDIVSGEKQGYKVYEMSDSVKVSFVDYSLAIQERRKINDEFGYFIKIGAVLSNQKISSFSSTSGSAWNEENRLKPGGIASIGCEYVFGKHIGINSTFDYRILSSEYKLNAAVVSLGIAYHL